MPRNDVPKPAASDELVTLRGLLEARKQADVKLRQAECDLKSRLEARLNQIILIEVRNAESCKVGSREWSREPGEQRDLVLLLGVVIEPTVVKFEARSLAYSKKEGPKLWRFTLTELTYFQPRPDFEYRYRRMSGFFLDHALQQTLASGSAESASEPEPAKA